MLFWHILRTYKLFSKPYGVICKLDQLYGPILHLSHFIRNFFHFLNRVRFALIIFFFLLGLGLLLLLRLCLLLLLGLGLLSPQVVLFYKHAIFFFF